MNALALELVEMGRLDVRIACKAEGLSPPLIGQDEENIGLGGGGWGGGGEISQTAPRASQTRDGDFMKKRACRQETAS